MEKAGNQLSRYGAIANPLPVAPNAKIFFVASSDSVDYQDLQNEFPVDKDGVVRVHTTIDAAIGSATADRGDVIYVMPGHTETVSDAGDIAADVGGVRIVGLGQGTARPKITFDTATDASVTVSDDDISFENIVFEAAFADIVAVFTLTTAKNFTLKDCEFVAQETDENFLAVVDTSTTDNAANGLTIEGCVWIEPDTATTSMVDVDADIDGMVVKDCYLNLGVNTSDLPAIAGVATGKDLTNVRIVGNTVVRLNDANPLLADPDTTTANTGVVAGNFVRHADTAGELLVTASTKIGFFDNLATAVDDASGYTLPAADS